MKDATDLKTEYLSLLDGQHKEQRYQSFIEENTRLLPREFIQNHGLSCSLALRKLAFGADYKSDFFYFSKSSDDWNAVFIEIEKPQSKFFKKSGNEFHGDFVHALQQINQWRAWLNAENQRAFLSSLTEVQVPKSMAVANPTLNKFVLVFGRRSEYEGSDLRKSLVRSQERDDFKIMTFDSLAEDIENKRPVYIGVRKNEYFDILGDEIAGTSLFSWVESSHLRISASLRDKLENSSRSNSFRMIDGNPVEALGVAAKAVRVRSENP